MTPQPVPQRNRRDHILPRGYLEGFTNRSTGQLSVFNIEQRSWFEAGTNSVAAARGFYDYSPDGAPDETADEAFKEFEEQFPVLRRELLAGRFSEWTKHADFLVRYSQMLRARSEIFREEIMKEVQATTFLKIDEVLETRPSTGRPGETDLKVKYSEFVPQDDVRRAELFKNLSITKMRAEIKRGAGEFARWHWCLRLTTDKTVLYVTSNNAVALIGSGPASGDGAMLHPDTIFVFPVCWQACLIGGARKFDTETETIHPNMLAELHRLYLNEADCRFAYSPNRLS